MSRVGLIIFSHVFGRYHGVRTLYKITASVFVPLSLALFLSACAVEGDFGRPRPTALTKITDEFLLNADIMTRGLNRPELERDEIILREAGHDLTRPMNLTPQLLDIPLRRRNENYDGRYERNHPIDPAHLIARELNKDHHTLTRFGEAARRVMQTYSQRMESLLRYDPNLRAKRREEARARMQENFDYIDSVFTDFGQRLQAYHYAIGDVRASGDNPMTAELESSLAHLRDRTAALEYELSQYFGAALARAEYHPPRFASRWRPGQGRSEPYGTVPDTRRYGSAPYGRSKGGAFK